MAYGRNYGRVRGGRVTRESIQDEWNGAFIKCLSAERQKQGMTEDAPPINWDKAEQLSRRGYTALSAAVKYLKPEDGESK